jgi:hypothetical protein
VLRGGQPWVRIATTDRVKYGVLTMTVHGVQNRSESRAQVMRYDPLTGVLR